MQGISAPGLLRNRSSRAVGGLPENGSRTTLSNRALFDPRTGSGGTTGYGWSAVGWHEYHRSRGSLKKYWGCSISIFWVMVWVVTSLPFEVMKAVETALYVW